LYQESAELEFIQVYRFASKDSSKQEFTEASSGTQQLKFAYKGNYQHFDQEEMLWNFVVNRTLWNFCKEQKFVDTTSGRDIY
jgi:hypothetical protein